MKTTSFTLITLLVLVGLSHTVFAQKATHLFNKTMVNQMFTSDSAQELFAGPRKNDINLKAVRDFIKSYNNIDNVKWYTDDDGFIAKFHKDGVETKVEYDKAGVRNYVLRSYNESHMSFELRDLVKRQYYDYNILVVYEIEHSRGITYIIKMMDKTSIKVLQVTDGEMIVLEDYIKG